MSTNIASFGKLPATPSKNVLTLFASRLHPNQSFNFLTREQPPTCSSFLKFLVMPQRTPGLQVGCDRPHKLCQSEKPCYTE